MASLRRLPRSPNYIACFTGSDGKRYQRSTGVKAARTVTAKREAQKIADGFEDIARRKKNVRQVQTVMKDLCQEILGENIPDSSLQLFAESWLTQKRAEVSPSTFDSYRNKINSFLKFLPEKVDQPLTEITKKDVISWRNHLAERVATSTVNHSLKILRIFFDAAKAEELIVETPAKLVKAVCDKKKEKKIKRRPFTIAETRALLEVADDEWRSMIIFGFYTGQRLGDIASLSWSEILLKEKEIRITTIKTEREQKIPIPQPLHSHIKGLDKPEFNDDPVHPRANAILAAQGRVGTLSRQFHDLMAKAGLIPKRKHRSTARQPGRRGKRKQSEISFHSLRHTTTSLLKNANVSSPVAEEIVGHDSAEINALYTHIKMKTMRKAMQKLPDVVS